MSIPKVVHYEKAKIWLEIRRGSVFWNLRQLMQEEENHFKLHVDTLHQTYCSLLRVMTKMIQSLQLSINLKTQLLKTIQSKSPVGVELGDRKSKIICLLNRYFREWEREEASLSQTDMGSDPRRARRVSDLSYRPSIPSFAIQDWCYLC